MATHRGGKFEQASTLGLAYLHLVRNKTPKVDNYKLTREHWKGQLILNNNLTGPKAAKILRDGGADAVSFGRDFISNPDLVERLRQGVELAEVDQMRIYTEGPEGFIDYPVAT